MGYFHVPVKQDSSDATIISVESPTAKAAAEKVKAAGFNPTGEANADFRKAKGSRGTQAERSPDPLGETGATVAPKPEPTAKPDGEVTHETAAEPAHA